MIRDSQALVPIMERANLALSPAHAELVASRAQAPAVSRGIDLPVVAVTEPPPVQQVFKAPDGRWLVASRFDQDPATVSRGGTYAPERVIRRLDALIEAGVDFDTIYILDELPATWEPGTSVPAMRPVEAEDRAEKVVARQEAIGRLGVSAAKALLGAAKGAGKATATAVSALPAAIAYDPVLLGGISDPATGQVAWVLVDYWDEVEVP